MKEKSCGCICNFEVSLSYCLRYNHICPVFRLEDNMSKKHLTFDDRLAIQAGLQQGMSVAQIAKNIGKDRSTVGREIKAHKAPSGLFKGQ